MGSQSTSYLTREIALAICKRKLKERKWWKESKKHVKKLSDQNLGNLMDRLIDSALYNFSIIDRLPDDHEQQRFTHYITYDSWETHSTGYYVELTLEDVLGYK